MVYPLDIILVRHGESEGNLAMKRGQVGDTSSFKNKDFKLKHNSLFRLTSLGVKQAKTAGKWIRENVDKIDKFYTSEYIRAMETAAHLELPNSKWKLDFMLRERDWGGREYTSFNERLKTKKDPKRKRNHFFYIPPRGESIAMVCTRLTKILIELHDYSQKRVIIVCHAETMRAFRVLLENITQFKFREMMKDEKRGLIHNCQIFHYSRISPKSKKVHKRLAYMRTVVPWDNSLVNGEWKKMKELGKIKKTSEELLNMVHKVPLVVNYHENYPLIKKVDIPEGYDDDEDEEEGEEENEKK